MLPAIVKAEVKLTTGAGVCVFARELGALDVAPGEGVGIVAVLFVGGERESDGRWILVDPRALRGRSGGTVSASRSVLAAAARRQPWLDGLRRHVDELWPAFLDAFGEAAELGHAALVDALARAHAAGATRELLPRHRILVAEHRAAVHALVDRHGECDAGRLAQDLFAYLVALAGYRKVTLNPVGVPDFLLEEPVREPMPVDGGAAVTLTLGRDEAARLVSLCRAAGEHELARALESGLAEVRDGPRPLDRELARAEVAAGPA
jgi:hypothetical protein